MNLLIVGGKFDKYQGKQSYIIDLIEDQLRAWIGSGFTKVNCVNGGNYEDLKELFTSGALDQYQALLWMPDIDNEEEKLLPNIKKVRPDIFLIQSKRVVEKDYNDFQVVKRLLESHSALGLKITKDDKYQFTVLDPLGNVWADKATLSDAMNVLAKRLIDISSLSRERSVSVGTRSEFKLEETFLDAVRDLGEQFTEYVMAANPDRFLGNASTRCCHGFPSKRSEHDTIYMSKRNVDKTIISNEQFVEVKGDTFGIGYYGDQKPSVDTPIQCRLYEYYKNVNYMVHGHVYVKDAPFTNECVPCGFLEEVDEILQLVPNQDATNFVVNLKGHGCIIMAKDVEFLTQHQFVTRPFMEIHD